MKIEIDNFEKFDLKLYDISIVQKEVDGGITSIEEIDQIKDYPYARSILISGLNQKTFEYFIKNYAERFEAISFLKNKKINDLSILSELENIKFLNFFFNQGVKNLWNMKNNINLKGLSIYDFSKLHTIDEITTAPSLEYFAIGNKVWAKMEIETFKPILNSNITHFSWCGKKVLDNDYICLSKSKITELDMNIGNFTMDELAKIINSFSNLSGTITIPYKELNVTENNKKTSYYCLCKEKGKLIKGIDEDKFKKYLNEFNKLLRKRD